jgi:hypothetical protein
MKSPTISFVECSSLVRDRGDVSDDLIVGSLCSDVAEHRDSGPEDGVWHQRFHERINL